MQLTKSYASSSKVFNFIFSGHHRCRLLKPTKNIGSFLRFHCFEISINLCSSARQLYHHLMKFQQHQISWSNRSGSWVWMNTPLSITITSQYHQYEFKEKFTIWFGLLQSFFVNLRFTHVHTFFYDGLANNLETRKIK